MLTLLKMSSYIIKFTNTSGESGTMIADAGFNYSEKLNEINQANIKITGSSVSKRSLVEVGSEVFISRNNTEEFHGLVNSVDFLEGGGISVVALGYEIWLAKENGDYSGSPWSSTASATIFTAVIGESNYFTAGTIEAGLSIDFSAEVTESLWNIITNLRIKTSQDIGVDYANSEIDILDHKGSSTSVATFNSGIQIRDIRVSQSYPIGNDVRVYGRSEGETRIKSDSSTYGQDATSKANYGTIRKIVRDPSISTEAEANILADALVSIYKDPIKVYDFDVINPNQSLVAGDVITLNAPSQGLDNEEVRIVGIERGFRSGNEYLTLEVTNKEYSRLVKNKNQVVAEIQKNARDNQTYDQYPFEYSNQNCLTCLGGIGQIGNGACGCSGDWFYLDGSLSAPTGVVQAQTLNIDVSSAFNTICNGLTVFGNVINNNAPTLGCHLANKTYVDACAGGGSSLWADTTNPYIIPCNSCQICILGAKVNGNICDSTSTHCLGIPSSPGAFKEVHAACGVFTTYTSGAIVCGTGATSGRFNGCVCIGNDLDMQDSDIDQVDRICATCVIGDSQEPNLLIEGYSDPVTIGGASVAGSDNDLWVVGDLDVGGSKAAVVPYNGCMLAYNALESAESWFKEYCSGKLCNGCSEIILDERFIGTTVISKLHPMQINLTPTGPCKGLMANKKIGRVIVKELDNGKSNATFDIEISAKRKGFEDIRFRTDELDNDTETWVKPKSKERFILEKENLKQKIFEKFEKFNKELESNKINTNSKDKKSLRKIEFIEKFKNKNWLKEKCNVLKR